MEEGRFGGPQKRVVEVAEILKLSDIETTVLIPDMDSERMQLMMQEKGVAYKTLPLHRLTKDPLHLLKYLLFFFYEIYLITQFLKKTKPDLVHCNGSWQIKGIIASKLAGIPNVWHLNDTYMPSYIKLIYNFTSKWACDNFIGACKRTVDFYLSNLPQNKKVKVIQSLVDTTIFAPHQVEADPEINKYKGIKMVMVGNLNPVKGHRTFIEAAAKFNGLSNIEAQFIMVGKRLENQKEYIQSLEDLCKEQQVQNAHFFGQSNNVKGILEAADIYVCSSDFEASPISVWEALAMAKPVVSTDVGDVKDIFEQNNCGLVVPVKDAEKMAQAILRLIEDQKLKETLKNNARATAVNNFDKKICAKNHSDFYHEILNTQIKNTEYVHPRS